MDAKSTLSNIEARLGFVPPFFGPAAEHAEVLDNLWRQTESAYLDNALPEVFKEKLSALLGRFCEMPYCLVCHTCSLRPLGMSGTEVVELLGKRYPTDPEISDMIARLDARTDTFDFGTMTPSDEQDVLDLASTLYFAGAQSGDARAQLRKRLAPADYQNLIVLTSYSKMCHEWVGAHPEISYELDQRYVQNYGPLAKDAPRLNVILAELAGERSSAEAARVDAVMTNRAAEISSAALMSERRLLEVVMKLKSRVAAAVDTASETNKLARELQRTADFAQELLAIVSHDLRNPLGNVLMAAELIRELEPNNTNIAGPLSRMMSNARRAERLIHDLLDFSQARAGGGIPIHRRPVDLHAIVRRAVEDIESVHPGRTFSVKLAGDGNGEWDADRLTQVLSNLFANAVSHGLAGTPIAVSTHGDDATVSVIISNANKVGPIPLELIPVLFDPFKRGVTHSNSSTRSVGLGLYIVHELVRGHGGTVEVSSTVEGTTFRVQLPRSGIGPNVDAHATR